MTAALFGRIQRMLHALFIGVVAFGVIASTSVASSVTYHYDSQGRLTGATYDDGTTVTYLFDDNGNRTDTIVTPAADTTPPSVPGSLTAIAVSPSQINLSWSASTDNVGVAGYKLERCQGAGCSNFAQIATPSTTSYPDAGRSESTTYVYRVRAYDGAENHSGYSGSASATTPATPDTTPPSVPTGLAASAPSSTQVNLSWNASSDTGGSGLAGYRIYRGGSQIGTSSTTSFSDTTVVGSTAYSYTVAAYDSATPANVSAQSSAAGVTTPDTIAPSVPAGLAASAVSSNQVNLSWSASTDTGGSGLAGYRIYRGGTQIGTSATTTYSDTTVVGSTAYSYTVAAYDNAAPANLSAQSNAAGVTTPDTIAPSIPTGLGASAPSPTQVNLLWNASTDTGGSGLAGYRIYRGGPQIGTSSTTSYSDTTVVASTAYSYTVAAYDNASPTNVSAQSSAANVTTPAPPDTTPPSVPTGLATTVVSNTQVNLTWNASTDTGGSGLQGYKVFRGGTQIGTSSTTSFSDMSVSPFNTYTYTVAAYDNATNTSAQSSSAQAKTFYQITEGSGTVVAAATALYRVDAGCQTNPNICRWQVYKKYGNLGNVITVVTGVNGSPPACQSGTTQQIAAGYQRSGCVLNAAPNSYGQ